MMTTLFPAILPVLISSSLFGAEPKGPGHHHQVDAQLRAMFRAADHNQDGFLDQAEMSLAFPNARFGYLDRNRDGRITWAEFDAYGEMIAARNHAAYSRYNRIPYYRHVRHHLTRVVHQAYRLQTQQGAVYSRSHPPVHRPVKSHGHRPAR